LHTLRTSPTLHFLLAVVVAFVLSIGLATAASLTGLIAQPGVDARQPAFWTARPAAERSTAVRRQQQAPTPAGAPISAQP